MTTRCKDGVVVWEGLTPFHPLTGELLPQGKRKTRAIVYLKWPDAGNKKIGYMAQTWIFLADVLPSQGIKLKLDRGICGKCIRAGGNKCYVEVGKLDKMWESLPFCRRMTPEAAGRILRELGAPLRIGAYGDPAAVPAGVWKDLTRYIGYSGYTHTPENLPELRGKIMASADSVEDARRLQKEGWQTYRIRNWDTEGNLEPLLPGEIACPADSHTEKGHLRMSQGLPLKSCANCLLCGSKIKKSVAIPEHSGVTMSRLARLKSAGKLTPTSPYRKRITADDIIQGAMQGMTKRKLPVL